MHRRALVVLVSVTTLVAAVLFTGVAVAQSTATGPSHAGKGRTLTFDVRFSPFFLIDFGTTGVRSVTNLQDADPSKGDVTVFQDQLLRAGSVVGRDGGSCTVTSVDVTADPPIQLSCTATFVLPGGTIATQGLASNAPVKPLVITGGTGAYLDAAGEAALTEFGDGTGSLVFHLAR